MTPHKLIVVFILFLVGCGSERSGVGDTTLPPTQGDRIVGLDVKSVPTVSYETAYSEAMALGAAEVGISLDWTDLEPSRGNYTEQRKWPCSACEMS